VRAGLLHPSQQPPVRSNVWDERFSTLSRSAARLIEGGPREKVALARLCERPEFRPLLREVRIRIRRDLGLPFRAVNGWDISMDSGVLANPALASLHLRHALEVAFWQRVDPASIDDPAAPVARAVLAARVALMYLSTLPRHELEAVLSAAPRWLAPLADQITACADHPGDETALLPGIARAWRDLLSLQGDDAQRTLPEATMVERACVLARVALPFAIATEYGLILGGDSRLHVDPVTRLNGYGCSPVPRPSAITFCSCTASSTSDLAYDEAERARQALLAQTFTSQALVGPFAAAMEKTRDELAAFLGLDEVPGSEIVFCSSGTDCELFALHFVLAIQPRPVVNIVVAPDEIGSGSMPAAHGFHFDRMAPLKRAVEPGGPVEGVDAARVRVVSLELRDDDGNLVPLADVDRRIERTCGDALANGEAALVHLLDSSKTGVRAPSSVAVGHLHATHPSAIFVVVDAAQMRTDNEGLVAYLRRGFMVMISGSKFYTGSPFSGALLVPPGLASAIDNLPRLPPGLADYTSSFELPPRWAKLRSGLKQSPNIGVFLRWRTALWEMHAYEAVAPGDRWKFFHAFAVPVRAAIDECPHARLIDAPVGDRHRRADPHRRQELQTIFTFLVLRTGSASAAPAPLVYDEARLVYFWLNSDISAALPASACEEERVLAAKRCHIGQPVRIRRAAQPVLGALRIAVGARFVSRVRFDPTLGPDVEARIAAQVKDVHIVLRKIRLILEHWNAINAGQGG
jgi:hypothetical protein